MENIDYLGSNFDSDLEREKSLSIAADIATGLVELANDLEKSYPAEWARSLSGSHAQSSKALAHDTILLNVLEASPGYIMGRPQNIRQLLFHERALSTIRNEDLSGILGRLGRTGIVEKGKYDTFYRRGAQPAQSADYVRPSGPAIVYNRSKLLDEIDAVLADDVLLGYIVHFAVLSGVLYRLVYFSMTVAGLQARENLELFHASHLPTFISKGYTEDDLRVRSMQLRLQCDNRAEMKEMARRCAEQMVQQAYAHPPMLLFQFAGLTYAIRRILKIKQDEKG